MESKNQENSIVVTELAMGEPFYIAGQKYLSRRDIFAHSKLVDGSCERYFSIHHHDNEKYILDYSERYPCFDSSDYLYEDRYYHAIFFCDSLDEANQKLDFLKAKYMMPSGVNHYREDWKYLSPFLYIDDGEKTFRVYEKRDAIGANQ